ncbi:glycosyltransferase family 2 protein [Mycetocola tolaasinivorans]|uniref:Glycosyltransferase family 2 protein n=1 Tax=Mycetocola tolaasinivorans TaxID=76635 RepID=A0A3L7AAE5_9MICO|nr:glycosyltransferase family 2 protein [Mycetocola tolaasinivorans]RLP77436.1 glycosyltransferase family 2 protein [Mycetocola tolaasinivorans]
MPISSSVSIAIPLYNVANLVEETLDSVLQQTAWGMAEISLLLIDDCSPDGSVAVAENYLQRAPSRPAYRLVRHQENRGLAAVRNTAIAESSTDFIWFVDSDDTVDPTMLEKMLQRMTIDVDIVATNVVRSRPDGSASQVRMRDYDADQSWSGSEALGEMIAGRFDAFTVNKLVRSSLYEGIVFPVGSTYEDVAVMGALLVKARRVEFINEALYRYLFREEAITSSVSPRIGDLLDNTLLCLQGIDSHASSALSVSEQTRFLYRNALIPIANLTSSVINEPAFSQVKAKARDAQDQSAPGYFWSAKERKLAFLAYLLNHAPAAYRILYRVSKRARV